MKFKLTIDRTLCKGCELCVSVCSRSVLRMAKRLNAHGQRFAELDTRFECVGCRRCADICPDAAIEIDRIDTSRRLKRPDARRHGKKD